MLDAVGLIIQGGGIGKVSTQSVADLAGVNKVLVYRYFGSVENLVEQYFDDLQRIMPCADKLLSAASFGIETEADLLISALKELLGQLWENKANQALLRRQLARGKLSSPVLLDYLSMKVRAGCEDSTGNPLKGALAALVYSAICYLALARAQGRDLGIDLTSAGARKRIETLIEDIVGAVFKTSS